MTEDKTTWAGLAVIAAIVFAAALVGGIGMVFADWQWYDKLLKPTFTPSNAVFIPVWIVLYAMMAVAAWLVWREEEEWEEVKQPLTIFGVQLFLNAVWTSLFFIMRSPLAALFDITLLGLAIVATVVLFLRVKILAALLLLPYLLWTGFAWLLNLVIWKWN